MFSWKWSVLEMGRRREERRKAENRVVIQSLAMVMQFGLNMIVPICMTTALGVWLDGKLGTSWITIVLFAAGAVAGGQNIYRMARGLYSDGGRDTEPGKSCGEDGAGRDIIGKNVEKK